MNFVDLHIHGAFGVDFLTASEAELEALASALSREGYAAFLPTLVPMSLDRLEAIVARLAAWIAARRAGDGRGARPLGIHFEGPFVSPDRAGALAPALFLDGGGARAAAARRFLDLTARLPGRQMITLAPEIPGGLELVREFARRGWLVALGHTDATFAQMEQAAEAGARHVTHLCNAMRPLHHREPGPIGFALGADAISVDVIADGHHLHPAMLAAVARAKPSGSLALISDAIPAAGLGPGAHACWGETITVRDGAARNARGALAGAATLLAGAVRNLEAAGVAAGTARACASSVPLNLIGAPAPGAG